MGFPTANLLVDPGDLPADGIYAARAGRQGEGLPWCATVSVGANPTFAGDRERRLEVHLHDVDVDLYGTTLVVEFVEFLRPTARFDDVAHLIRQSALDVTLCRERLAAAASGHLQER